MTLAVEVDANSRRPRAPLSRRWNLAFNLITIGFCVICALFSLWPPEAASRAATAHSAR
jgi:hypothetical protein